MARIALIEEFVEINVMRKSRTAVEGAVRLGRESKAELHSPKYLPDTEFRAALDWHQFARRALRKHKATGRLWRTARQESDLFVH